MTQPRAMRIIKEQEGYSLRKACITRRQCKPVMKAAAYSQYAAAFVSYFLLLIKATSTISKQFMIPMKTIRISKVVMRITCFPW